VIEAVLSYHMSPMTCGVAKFNHALARRLGVPCLNLMHGEAMDKHVLVSIKSTEIPLGDFNWWARSYDLLLHDRPSWITQHPIGLGAQRTFYADEVGCPSTVEGNPTRGAYRVLAFGMSHKLALTHFEALKIELDRDHPDYTIELSTAVHEGNPWDEALTESTEAMRAIFGDRLRVLGFLADDAIARVLAEVDAVAAFYTPALRANNTTAWAALSAGKFLYTNLDEHSPELNPEKYSWDALLKVLA
jgi:hypothetical protein